MEKTDMNIKLQNSGTAGKSNTKGSCAALANYLNHEDNERRSKGLPVIPFTTPDGTPVTLGEVIEKIDRNTARLSKTDDKFFQLIVSPSKDEIKAMGETEEEQYEAAKIIMQHILDRYALGFNIPKVTSASDLCAYYKPHFSRGDKGELEMHIHVIISRRAKGNGPKISCMTNHINTPPSGPVKRGFDRKSFAADCEKIADQDLQYERKVEESFEYLNAQANGTAEEKAIQAERLAREQLATLNEAMQANLAAERKKKRERAKMEELAAMLQQKDFKLPDPEQNVADLIDTAAIANDLMHTLSISGDELSMKINLASLGINIQPVPGENDVVQDIMLMYKGKWIRASAIMDRARFITALDHWSRLTGKESAYRAQERQKREKAERKLKLTQRYENTQARSRGIRLHF